MKKTIVAIFVIGLAIAGLAAVSFAASCGGQSSSAMSEKAQGMEEATAEMSGQATPSQAPVNVGNKTCPVSGEALGQEGMEPVTYEHEGKVYNFCCAACIEEFKKDPAKYSALAEEEAAGKKE